MPNMEYWNTILQIHISLSIFNSVFKPATRILMCYSELVFVALSTKSSGNLTSNRLIPVNKFAFLPNLFFEQLYKEK